MYALYRGVCTKAYAGSGKPSFETHVHCRINVVECNLFDFDHNIQFFILYYKDLCRHVDLVELVQDKKYPSSKNSKFWKQISL